MAAVIPEAPTRLVRGELAALACRDAAGTGVTLAFSERTGGVSPEPWASLNMGGAMSDAPENIAENRRRLMAALGAEDLAGRIVRPAQVHGDAVALISDAAAPIPAWVGQGCDAVVCTAPDVPVMLLFADCVPVVLACPGGFAVVHSGWRGTYAEISLKAARVLLDACGRAPEELAAWVGPHISAAAYEVSPELAAQFAERFGSAAVPRERHLDLTACITASLAKAGVGRAQVCDCGLCTATLTSRFFSHRAEAGAPGRHCAVAFMRAPAGDAPCNDQATRGSEA